MHSDLIARLEALSGPDRETDCHIWASLQGIPFDLGRQVVGNFSEWVAPHYTASIDSAMTLVNTPFWMIRNSMDGPVATIIDTSGREYEGNGDNAAIAMCIAALRARSADNG